ncbi:MAG: UPF0149 family protein, partial [Yoonia sp.]
MDQSDQELDRLDELLHALPAENMPMTLSELDGYVVGVLACPDMIPSSEWISGPVAFLCRPKCSFKPPFVRRRQGFS